MNGERNWSVKEEERASKAATGKELEEIATWGWDGTAGWVGALLLCLFALKTIAISYLIFIYYMFDYRVRFFTLKLLLICMMYNCVSDYPMLTVLNRL